MIQCATIKWRQSKGIKKIHLKLKDASQAPLSFGSCICLGSPHVRGTISTWLLWELPPSELPLSKSLKSSGKVSWRRTRFLGVAHFLESRLLLFGVEGAKFGGCHECHSLRLHFATLCNIARRFLSCVLSLKPS